MARAIPKRNEPTKGEYLTQEEVYKLLNASRIASRNPQRDFCILLLMFRHGLRVSELCSLKLSDVDLNAKVFHVRRVKGCDHGVHEFYSDIGNVGLEDGLQMVIL
jgi:integrase